MFTLSDGKKTFFTSKFKMLGACLVIKFKNYYLKRCENCDLKSVVEKYVLVFIKQKKKKMFGIMV